MSKLTVAVVSAALLAVVFGPLPQRTALAADAPTPEEDAATKIDALETEVARLNARLEAEKIPAMWLVVGFFGQFIFGMRFIVQWIATELKKKSVVPVAFWYLSLTGTIVLLSYSIYKRDPVFIAGFSLNMIIYLRNLYFIHFGPTKATND